MIREITCTNLDCGQEFDPQLDRDSDEGGSWITYHPCPYCGQELDDDYLADLEIAILEDSIETYARDPDYDDLPF